MYTPFFNVLEEGRNRLGEENWRKPKEAGNDGGQQNTPKRWGESR